MSGYTIELLSGTVRIPASAPTDWEEKGLDGFYQNPNNAEWGKTLCRVLYHESVHIWQFLASGYLANLMAEEWVRLQHFENTGEVSSRSQDLTDYTQREAGEPFSPYELVECWARFWDVHTRNPVWIIEDEFPDLKGKDTFQINIPGYSTPAYTAEAYDLFMKEGRDCARYAAPYRWMLEQANGHSAFVQIVFPIITHQAFGSPQPVTVFRKAFERARKSELLEMAIDNRCGCINLDWLNQWCAVIGEAVYPVITEESLPVFTSGFDAICRGPLKNHPIYKEYPEMTWILQEHLKMMHPKGDMPIELRAREEYAMSDMPSRDPWVLFGLPGQPTYRYLLGRYLPPPRVCFENFIYAARPRRLVTIRMAGVLGSGTANAEPTFEVHSADLEKRILRFRAAERALSLGLPPDAFEKNRDRSSEL